MTKPIDALGFGVDVSRHQGVIDWEVVADYRFRVSKDDPSTGSGSVQFAGIRAGISWGYVDSFFERNWLEARRVGIPRTAYHVFYPLEDAVRQAKQFHKIVSGTGDLGDIAPVVDVELDHGCGPLAFGQRLKTYLDAVADLFGVMPIIYSRASFIDEYVTDVRHGGVPYRWYGEYDWWLAQYLRSGVEHPGPVALPKGVGRERVVIHQTSDKGDPIGVQSKAMDYNRLQVPIKHLLIKLGASGSETVYTQTERVRLLRENAEAQVGNAEAMLRLLDGIDREGAA